MKKFRNMLLALAMVVSVFVLAPPAQPHGSISCTGNTWHDSQPFGYYVYASGSCTSTYNHAPRYLTVTMQKWDANNSVWYKVVSGTKELTTSGTTISKQVSDFCSGNFPRITRAKIYYEIYYSGGFDYGTVYRGQQEQPC